MAQLPYTNMSRMGSGVPNGIAITVQVEGAQKVIGYLTSVEQLGNLKQFINEEIDKIYDKIKDTAPWKTHYYEEHIYKHYDGQYDMYIETTAPYSKYLIYGGPTLYKTALIANARGIHWPYSRVVGTEGIIHDIRRIIYEWRAEFDAGLENVDFSQPREYTSSGRILPLRGASGKWRSG